MSEPVSLLKDVRGFYRDMPRDRLPQGSMWDMADFIPALLDAQLTGRGAWAWGSAALPAVIEGGIHATFKDGDRLLVLSNGQVHQVKMTDPGMGGITTFGTAVGNIVQNPMLLADQVIVPHIANTAPKVLTSTASTLAFGVANVGALPATGRYGAVYKSRAMVSGGTGFEERLYFSPVDSALLAWEDVSWEALSLPITGVGALRGMILVFHAGSVERIRGSEPSHLGNPKGDFTIESLFDRAGCGDARSIAYWNDNCIFADERGVHLTDGAIVRNLITQGGLTVFWRELFLNRISIAAETYLDYYIVTVVRSTGVAVTLVCDLQRRSWFRFTNIRARSYIRSYGMQEQLWGGQEPEHRLITLADCFFPIHTELTIDDDGVPVLPMVETAWHRLGNEGRKRIRFVYTSYDIRTTATGFRKGRLPDDVAQETNGQAKAALPLLEVGYTTDPYSLPGEYVVAGVLPETDEYTRRRLPVNKQPYGIGFRLKQTAPSTVTRIAEYEVDAQATERSRL